MNALRRTRYLFQQRIKTVIPTTYGHRDQWNHERNYHSFKFWLTCSVSVPSIIFYHHFKKSIEASEHTHQTEDIFKSYGNPVKSLPTFKLEEVSKHDKKENRIWVTFRSGVYDVTDFIDSHPGGTDKILMAAGSSVDPFWELYAIHANKSVLELLESFRIGNLDEDDRDTSLPSTDHWGNEPKRHALLTPRSMKPFNAEPPPSLLTENHATPNALFFVRNHLPVPVIDENEYRLQIEGLGLKKPVQLTLKDLKSNKFRKITVSSTIQCAGNRRSEMNKVKEVKGLFWGNAAISNATWTGVRLMDVLKYCKTDLNHPGIKHIQFEGLDSDPVQGTCYGASIPSDRALTRENDVILAFEMNGQPLPRDHGFPVRAIVPGVVGARQVKWLGKIILSDQESDSHWQQRDYKGFNPSTDAGNADWSSAKAIQDYPIQSSICVPEEGSSIESEAGHITIKGYAYAGGGRAVTRVDVSADGGKTWFDATIKSPHDKENLNRKYDWTLWEAKIPVKKGAVQLVCKATDSAYNSQPESFEGTWNFRGVLSHAWSRVNVKVL